MDYEFHYYVTFLIARSAGFSNHCSQQIAYSAQYTDDNSHALRVYDQHHNLLMENHISQTCNIMLSEQELESIYCCFHFPPTLDMEAPSFQKPISDYRTHPYNALAKNLLLKALQLNNPFLIGIASHAYHDSFAHAGFSGKNDPNNSHIALPFKVNFGHAYYGGLPDMIGVKWRDIRTGEMRNNNKCFLKAASSLFDVYADFCGVKQSIREHMKQQLLNNLNEIFGEAYTGRLYNFPLKRKSRIKQYIAFSNNAFHFSLSEYNSRRWIKQAVFFEANQKVWLAKHQFENSNWLQFQHAVQIYKTLHAAIVDYDSTPQSNPRTTR